MVSHELSWYSQSLRAQLITCGALLCITGCSLIFDESKSNRSVLDAANVDAVSGDAPAMDANLVDASDAWICGDWMPAPQHFDPCEIQAPSGHLDLNDTGIYTFNTDSGILTSPTAGETQLTIEDVNGAILISISQLTVRANVTLCVVGSKTLIVAAWDQIVLETNSQIDVGSRENLPGAGARSSCPNDASVGDHTPSGQDGPSSGDGGGGGGFGGRGGPGGWAMAMWGASGAAETAPSMVLGGCPGASGGAALEEQNGGSGGGGSGGMIGLEAVAVELGTNSVISANGGGGGGSSCGPGSPGNRGQDGRRDAMVAQGGPGGMDTGDTDGVGGRGGNGGFGGSLEGIDGSNDSMCGGKGGGGGGGVGYVIIKSQIAIIDDGTISPTAISPAP